MAKTSHDARSQLLLPFSAVRNSNFLSHHWLDNRLPLEPDWDEFKNAATTVCGEIIEIWKRERTLVEKYGDEAGLEEAFIQPILRALGWELKYQAFLYGREPDYALFTDAKDRQNAINAGRKNDKFWEYPKLLADAKAWHINLDRPIRRGKAKEYPPEQIEWYLQRSHLDYAILTNGKLWRLVPRDPGPGNPRFQTYFEVDLPQLIDPLLELPQFTLEGEEFAEFLRFYFLFRPMAFVSANERAPLIDRAIAGSSAYRLGVSEDLKDQVFEALRLAVEGFFFDKNNQLSSDEDLSECRNEGLVFLYRILFIMFAEDRALLPVGINTTYTNNHSLRRYREEIAGRLDNVELGKEDDYDRSSYAIWGDLFDLFDLVDTGRKRYDVGEFNGGLFNPERTAFFGSCKINDWYIARIIDCLSRAPGQSDEIDNVFAVDYRDLSIKHLGSVYEGLIELVPKCADEIMVVYKSERAGKRTEVICPKSQPAPKGFTPTEICYQAGSIYLETDKGERRNFGSYYTPDNVVDHIVQNTLGPLCTEIDRSLNEEISAAEEELNSCGDENRQQLEKKLICLQGNFDERVLDIRVLDPAMGSGHFLVRACEYLAEEIATNPHTEDPEADQLFGDESVLNYWKRRVVEACIYGVDLNPMAVELAKVALWLATIEAGPPLSFLNHHLRFGNSLMGGRVKALGVLPDSPEIFKNSYEQQIIESLPAILAPFAEIEKEPSKSASDVKQKEQLLSQRFELAITDLRHVANAWFGCLIEDDRVEFTHSDYEELVGGISKGSVKRFEAKINEINEVLEKSEH